MEVTFDYKIYGTHKRDGMIAALNNQLNNLAEVVYDDRPNGGDCIYTCTKAFTKPITTTHRVAFTDDLEVCPDFLEIIKTVCTNYPDAIVSLYAENPAWDITEVKDFISPYVLAPMVNGNGIIMPTKYIEDCFKSINEWYNLGKIKYEDEGMTVWARLNKVRIITLIPSLVQHIGKESLLVGTRPFHQSPFFKDWDKADFTKIELNCFKINNWIRSKYEKI